MGESRFQGLMIHHLTKDQVKEVEYMAQVFGSCTTVDHVGAFFDWASKKVAREQGSTPYRVALGTLCSMAVGAGIRMQMEEEM